MKYTYKSMDCMKSFCESLREPEMKITNFKKKKYEVINKWTAGIKWKFKKYGIFVKKKLKINNIIKLEIIAIMKVNIEVLHIVYAT